MARQRQLHTLDQIESTLGYNIDYLDDADKDILTFYSDLTPVPKSSYKRALREHDEYRKQNFQGAASSHELRLVGVPKVSHEVVLVVRLSEADPAPLTMIEVISSCGDTVVAECTHSIGLYRFKVRIHHDSGFDLRLRLTETEASRFMTVTKLQIDNGDKSTSIFFRLPRELRERVYMFSIPTGDWKVGDVDAFDSTFAGAMGDPTGFYFPLSKDLSVLRINKQIRQEALPIAYRRTVFHLDDIDDFIKVAVSIGQIGRANVESVGFSWESRSDLRHRMDETPDFENSHFQLPALHVLRCVPLLKECRRLAFLRIYFETDLISTMSSANFRANPGIRELSSVRGIQRVEIGNAVCEPLDHCEFIKWLKGKLVPPDNKEETDAKSYDD